MSDMTLGSFKSGMFGILKTAACHPVSATVGLNRLRRYSKRLEGAIVLRRPSALGSNRKDKESSVLCCLRTKPSLTLELLL